MKLNNQNPSGTLAWQNLREHFIEEMQSVKMQELFANDRNRAEKFSIEWNDFFIDFSKNRISDKTLKLLFDLANEMELSQAINYYFKGDKINQTEKRAVLHTALRAKQDDVVLVDGVNVIPEIYSVKEKIKSFSENLINGNYKGYTGKNITDVVNIGIGGSDLGPAMVVDALKFYQNHLTTHFVSNIDGDQVHETLKKLNPETTLFVVVSKTFTTQETITNANTIKKWFLQSATEKDIAKHFVAVSTNLEKVEKFGILSDNVFPMWDWVGGRFSLWSAVGLSIALAIGFDNFDNLLFGANEMDNHFRSEKLEQNIPVILALVSVWYNNFFGAETEAIIPYSQYLQKLVPYLQQGIMESNGKSVGRDGNITNYQTGTIIWGEPGSNSQHAFFQLIHQGTKLIPCDFIGFKKSLHNDIEHHNKLMSNFFAQTEALLMGKTEEEVLHELSKKGFSKEEIDAILPFKVFQGNKPTNTILVEKLSPKTLGSLIAMYEHKIFVQGIIWNIYSYDQWGVELGKELANSILSDIESGDIKKHDSSTSTLIKKYLS